MPSSATAAIYSLSLHDALPISDACRDVIGVREAFVRDTQALEQGFGHPAALRLPGVPLPKLPPVADQHQEGDLVEVGQRDNPVDRSEEHTSELQSLTNLVCRLLPPQRSTLFPYTTLFRSRMRAAT